MEDGWLLLIMCLSAGVVGWGIGLEQHKWHWPKPPRQQAEGKQGAIIPFLGTWPCSPWF